MSYIGQSPIVGNFQICDAISVVNGQAAYTMQVGSANVSPETANHMIVSLNGVIQKPNSSYTISGSTITFASNLASGDVIDFIQLLGDVLDIGTPSDGAVTSTKLASNSVTTAKITDSNVTGAKTNFVSTSSAAGLQIKGDGTTDGTLQLNCSQNSHGIKLASPAHSSSQSYTLKFPTGNVTADKFLKVASVSGSGTSGIGQLSFADAGETNTPIFFVSGGNQTISHNSDTKMNISTESIDTDNCFDLGSNNRFTPNKAGKYFFTLRLFSPSGDDINYWSANVRKNGSGAGGFSGVQRDYNSVGYNGILTANGSGDYFEAYCEQESGSNRTISVSEFSAFFIAT